LLAGSSSASAQTPVCAQLSPIAAPCTGLDKVTGVLASPAARRAAVASYTRSWEHRIAAFQYSLGDALPLGQAQWLGTHNSFNSPAETLTVSHVDSNQQLTLTEQLDVDVRSIELDLHWLMSLAGREVIVCHGRGPDELDVGCTSEPPFRQVLSEVARWLNAHPDTVLLLYLEDELHADDAYPVVIRTLDEVLRRAGGASLIYVPDTGAKAKNGCTPLPLSVTRADMRRAGKQVVLVGSCAPGWSSRVFDWNASHVESGSAARYRSYPACDASYDRGVYAQKLVRYYEDTTFVATVIDPTRPPMDPEALTPQRAAEMTACGVNLFGFDQLQPADGRIAATLWSFAPGEPSAAGDCTLQRADGRWAAAPCRGQRHRAACVRRNTWKLSRKAVTGAGAHAACRASKAAYVPPRSGLQNSQLHAVAGAAAPVWVAVRRRPAR
jgi:hypothetical protein